MGTRIISPEPTSSLEYLSDLIKYRSLVTTFAIQEIKSTYAQTYLRWLWVLLKPLVTLSVYTVVFKWFLNVPTQSSYYLFAFCGIIGWSCFSFIAIQASTSVVNQRDIIRKMYFPKLILLFSKVCIAAIELGLALLIMIGLLIWEGIYPDISFFTLPIFILLNILCGLTIAIWMNAFNIHFRDLHQFVPIAIGVLFWLTPVFYPLSIIPEQYRFLVFVNPMAGIIQGYRYALLGEVFPSVQYLYGIVGMIVLLITGIFYFIKAEDKMVDYA